VDITDLDESTINRQIEDQENSHPYVLQTEETPMFKNSNLQQSQPIKTPKLNFSTIFSREYENKEQLLKSAEKKGREPVN